MSTAVAFTRH